MRPDPLSLLRQVFDSRRFAACRRRSSIAFSPAPIHSRSLPTGRRKSLCYQLPAVALPGTCVVVSPLIALMHDQLRAARTLGIRAASLTSVDADWRETQDRLVAGELDLLYVAPERAAPARASAPCWSAATSRSSPSTKRIASPNGAMISVPITVSCDPLLDAFPSVPRLALTATADRHTREDILAQLGIPPEGLIISGFDRAQYPLRRTAARRGEAPDRRHSRRA